MVYRSFKSSALSFRPMRASCLASGTRSFHASPPRGVLYAKADQQTFTKAINAKGRIAVVDFYADWCGPCHQLAPVVESLTNEPNKSGSGFPFDLVKVDTDSDEGQIIGAKYKIRALPTVIAFRDGTPVSQFVGALNEAGVREFLNQL
ncbi:hypothetical protein GALMADRAFT_251339 [Galerina marginata CBS 339.88]|uniref:Thioredoxin domain-containing protein n=1 Tax=Galerina marginata (strain CBS 339.88) TaxID=685588 RepID=A0A067SU62_GALM3|nr:hypothetical protein GALMADRAFT_251339 [Galerina marginata CBS 339.88]